MMANEEEDDSSIYSWQVGILSSVRSSTGGWLKTSSLTTRPVLRRRSSVGRITDGWVPWNEPLNSQWKIWGTTLIRLEIDVNCVTTLIKVMAKKNNVMDAGTCSICVSDHTETRVVT